MHAQISMIGGTFRATNQELSSSTFQLILALGSDAHYNPARQTFRIRYIPIHLRRFFDVVNTSPCPEDEYFVCKPSVSLEFASLGDLPDDESPEVFVATLHRHFLLDKVFNVPKADGNLDFKRLVFARKDVGPVPCPDRWILTYLEPIVTQDSDKQRYIRYKMEQYKAYFLLDRQLSPVPSPAPTVATWIPQTTRQKPSRFFWESVPPKVKGCEENQTPQYQ